MTTESERDAMRDALTAIQTCAERAIGLDPSSMDNCFVQIQDIARAALSVSGAAVPVGAPAEAALSAPQPAPIWEQVAEIESMAPEPMSEMCQPNGLMFDAFGEPRTRYVRVTLNRNHCVMHPIEGDCYVEDARNSGDPDWDLYIVRDVWLSEREFENLPEHEGF